MSTKNQNQRQTQKRRKTRGGVGGIEMQKSSIFDLI